VTNPSAEMPKEDVHMLLSFQIFLIPRVKFSYFVTFSASVLKRLRVNRTSISITSAVLFSLSISTIFGLLKSSFYQL
jgi:hypothetical protein